MTWQEILLKFWPLLALQLGLAIAALLDLRKRKIVKTSSLLRGLENGSLTDTLVKPVASAVVLGALFLALGFHRFRRLDL